MQDVVKLQPSTLDTIIAPPAPLRLPHRAGSARPCLLASTQRRGRSRPRGPRPAQPDVAAESRGSLARRGAPRRHHRAHSRPRSAHARSGRLFPLLTPARRHSREVRGTVRPGQETGTLGLEVSGGRSGPGAGCQASPPRAAPRLRARRTGALRSRGRSMPGGKPSAASLRGSGARPTRARLCPGGARGRGAARASWSGAGRGGGPGVRGAPRGRARSACPRTRR